MGAKIRSKIDVVYDPRDQIASTIVIELTNWTYNVGQGYVASIKDSIYNDTSDEIIAMAGSAYPGGIIRTKTKTFSIAEVGFLYSAIVEVAGPIAEGEDYTAYMDKLLANAVLYLTQHELKDGKTVYGLLPNQWEVVLD